MTERANAKVHSWITKTETDTFKLEIVAVRCEI